MMRIQEGPVAKHDHMFTIIGDGIGFGGVDDHRPIMALLFLQAGMAVIPIGAALQQRKFIHEGGVRLDAGKADARHPVHLERDDRSEEHTSELQSLMRISYAVFCLKKKTKNVQYTHHTENTS